MASRITADKLKDFFKYYKSQPNQQEGIDILHSVMPVSLLEEDTAWIVKYREPEPEKDLDPTGICTPDLMSRLTGYSPSQFDNAFCNDCNNLFDNTGFSNHLDAMQMLMANMMHESASFQYMKERASGWAYEGREDLGNTSPGDGPKYKGVGVLQVTGKYNYSRVSQALGDPKVMDGVDYVADAYPFSSAQVWIMENDLLDVCLRSGFNACCTRINGRDPANGLADRQHCYAICQREMK